MALLATFDRSDVAVALAAVAMLALPAASGAAVTLFDDTFADNAFVDAASWTSQTGAPPTADPALAIGYDLTTAVNYSLHDEGKQAVLRLDFTDNVIIDGPGWDIVVYEAAVPESFEIAAGLAGAFHAVDAGDLVLKDDIGPHNVNAAYIDLADLGVASATVLRLQLTDTAADGSADILAVGTVPEPTTLALLLAGIPVWARFRRTKRTAGT